MSISSNKIKATFVLALFALVTGAVAGSADTPKEGSPFPDLTRSGVEGKLPDLQGKIVLVDFFASWCGPCKESFPVMEELYQKYHPKGFVVVAVNLDSKKDNMEEFLKKHPVSFTIVRDTDNKLAQQIKIPAMPSSFVLDREGRVYACHHGFETGKTRKEYVKEIESLLK